MQQEKDKHLAALATEKFISLTYTKKEANKKPIIKLIKGQ
jgi:hypothetical protein